MAILITGGCGFIASNFINYFFNRNDMMIVNLDAMYYCASHENIDIKIRSSSRYKFIKGNTSNEELVSHILENNNIQFVINFAAQSHVTNSFSESLQYTKDNIVGTHTLLECCRNYGKIQKIIHISTDEVYGESNIDDDDAKNEKSLLCPTNPYAATKAAAEMLAFSYRKSFDMPIIITRGNNVYGPNQYPEKVIPKFIKLLKENKKVTIEGNGGSIRGFLHVYDVVRAIDLILNKGKLGEIYNIGCEEKDEISIIDLAKLLIFKIHHTENYENHICFVKDRDFNDKRYYIDNIKLKNMGWSSCIIFNTGLDELINN